MSTRPLPNPDPATAPYWEAAKDHRLVLPLCLACGKPHFYPHPLCPYCGADRFEWVPAAGTGSVYSFTIVKRAPSPAFEALVPYAVAIIALDEGPHLMSTIVDCDIDALRIGDRVHVDFLDFDDAPSLPVFKREG
jgi:uncharacterized protein